MALIHEREKGVIMDVLRQSGDDEEELHRPSDQTNFKVEVNGQVQVQVLQCTV